MNPVNLAQVRAAMDTASEAELRRRGSLKWTLPPDGTIGAFVAETDLPLAPAIRDAIDDAVTRGLTTYLPPALAARASAACAEFIGARYGWQVEATDVHQMSGVLHILEFVLRRMLPPGTPVVLPLPTYMPFLMFADEFGADLRTVPMMTPAVGSGDAYTLDLAALREALTKDVPDTGALLVLINPHNPTGRVFTRDELSALASVVDETGATVFADEIHAPLVYPGGVHVPYASLSEVTAAHTLTAMSASKGWNVPGLNCGQLIVSSDRWRERLAGAGVWVSIGTSPLGAVAAEAAYSAGVDHLDACVTYLDEGRQLFAAALARSLPAAGFRPPEGTYLGWVDLRGVADPAVVPELCQVLGTDGTDCGTPGFLRLTLGTAHPILAEMAERLGRLGGAAG